MPILGSSASQSGRAPGQPTSVSATAGDAQATVTFTVPAYTGKGTVNYTATSSPGGFTASGSSSPLVVTGLSNGTSYTFTVRATTAGVQGSASSASASVTPALPAYALSQTFNASGTYTVPSGKNHMAIIVVGAGGGGGGGSPFDSAKTGQSEGPMGGGGAGGGYIVSAKEYPISNGQTYSVTIGAAGNAGNTVNSPASSGSNAGNAGGQTLFSNLVTLNGGNGGGAGNHTAGGAGGTSGNYSTNISSYVNATAAGATGGAGGFTYDRSQGLYNGANGANATITDNYTGLGSVTKNAGAGAGGGGGGNQMSGYGGYSSSGGTNNNGGGSGGGGAYMSGEDPGYGDPGRNTRYGYPGNGNGGVGGSANAVGGGGGGGGGGGTGQATGNSLIRIYGNPAAGGNGYSGQVLVYVR